MQSCVLLVLIRMSLNTIASSSSVFSKCVYNSAVGRLYIFRFMFLVAPSFFSGLIYIRSRRKTRSQSDKIGGKSRTQDLANSLWLFLRSKSQQTGSFVETGLLKWRFIYKFAFEFSAIEIKVHIVSFKIDLFLSICYHRLWDDTCFLSSRKWKMASIWKCHVELWSGRLFTVKN